MRRAAAGCFVFAGYESEFRLRSTGELRERRMRGTSKFTHAPFCQSLYLPRLCYQTLTSYSFFTTPAELAVAAGARLLSGPGLLTVGHTVRA
jgi:hypothetical protein